MHVRRLVKAGESSHTVALPKQWLDRCKLKKGDVVYLFEDVSGELRVSTDFKEQEPERREITIDVKGKAPDTLQREVTSAYVNNYSVIRLVGEDVGKLEKYVREVLNNFIALEIAEQSPKSIVVKDMLDLREVDVSTLVKRMDMLVRSMLQEGVHGKVSDEVLEEVRVKDDDVNRLYFLLYRLLKAGVREDSVASQLGLSRKSILSRWYVMVNVENMADAVRHVYSLLSTKKMKEVADAQSILSAVETMYAKAMAAFYKSDKSAADSIARERLHIVESASRLPGDVGEVLKVMVTIVNNIARMVIDEE